MLHRALWFCPIRPFKTQTSLKPNHCHLYFLAQLVKALERFGAAIPRNLSFPKEVVCWGCRLSLLHTADIMNSFTVLRAFATIVRKSRTRTTSSAARLFSAVSSSAPWLSSSSVFITILFSTSLSLLFRFSLYDTSQMQTWVKCAKQAIGSGLVPWANFITSKIELRKSSLNKFDCSFSFNAVSYAKRLQSCVRHADWCIDDSWLRSARHS